MIKLTDLQLDSLNKIKIDEEKRLNNNKKFKNKNKSNQRKARRTKIKNALKSSSKSLAPLAPILVTLISDKIVEVAINNSKIEKLIDDTNKIIEEANNSQDPSKLTNAKISRDNALRVIQKNIELVDKIKKQLENINIYINVFNILVQIISALPIPTSTPPGIGIPISVIMKFTKLLDKASRISSVLSTALPILISTLDKVIEELIELKNRLLQINAILESNAAGNNGGDLVVDGGLGGDYGEYKGFKFAIKEENNPRLNISGNKRHYAVAIDTNNVEVLKSELSFTLDPGDLIESLKIVIDSNNLIA